MGFVSTGLAAPPGNGRRFVLRNTNPHTIRRRPTKPPTIPPIALPLKLEGGVGVLDGGLELSDGADETDEAFSVSAHIQTKWVVTGTAEEPLLLLDVGVSVKTASGIGSLSHQSE